MTSADAARARLAELERREAELLGKLQRCIPPVDQHRHDLQIVRTQIAEARNIS